MSEEDIGVRAAAYMALKQKIKDLTAETNSHKEALTEYVDNNGDEDAKGNILVNVEYAGVTFELKKECRVSTVQTPEIEEVLKANLGPVSYNRAVEVTVIPRDDVISLMHEQGKISDEVLAKCYVENTNYAFKVKKL